MVLVMVVCAVTGDLLLKRGMSAVGAVQLTGSGLSHGLLAMMSSLTIWAGILFLLAFMASQMTVMSWADYSYVMPAGAFGYALQTLLAVVILHETVTAKRWIGVSIICVGVVLVGQTKPRTTTAPATTPVAAQNLAKEETAEKVTASC